VSPQIAATLGFIEKMTLNPERLEQADADTVRATGVSDEGLRTAATVAAVFNMIVRLADSFGWDVPSPERLAARAPAMLDGGYSLTSIGGR
jgi:alkylhydroperoxidase family enzyme